jgi:uncharacterized phage protein (TIGR01671 family)
VNREIKFRAYQPEAKGDLKWWSWQELRESDLNTIFRHPERYHLMQYTGLKDKNGVEIYEGDICRAAVYKDPIALRKSMMINSLVVFHDGAFILDGHKRLPDGFRTLPTFDDCEVIGNIHDNPELLEVD